MDSTISYGLRENRILVQSIFFFVLGAFSLLLLSTLSGNFLLLSRVIRVQTPNPRTHLNILTIKYRRRMFTMKDHTSFTSSQVRLTLWDLVVNGREEWTKGLAWEGKIPLPPPSTVPLSCNIINPVQN